MFLFVFTSVLSGVFACDFRHNRCLKYLNSFRIIIEMTLDKDYTKKILTDDEFSIIVIDKYLIKFKELKTI